MEDIQALANRWLPILRAEYREMPGLQLTRSQVKRMWTLDDPVCAFVLTVLVKEQFLQLTSRGLYSWSGIPAPRNAPLAAGRTRAIAEALP